MYNILVKTEMERIRRLILKYEVEKGYLPTGITMSREYYTGFWKLLVCKYEEDIDNIQRLWLKLVHIGTSINSVKAIDLQRKLDRLDELIHKTKKGEIDGSKLFTMRIKVDDTYKGEIKCTPVALLKQYYIPIELKLSKDKREELIKEYDKFRCGYQGFVIDVNTITS